MSPSHPTTNLVTTAGVVTRSRTRVVRERGRVFDSRSVSRASSKSTPVKAASDGWTIFDKWEAKEEQDFGDREEHYPLRLCPQPIPRNRLDNRPRTLQTPYVGYRAEMYADFLPGVENNTTIKIPSLPTSHCEDMPTVVNQSAQSPRRYSESWTNVNECRIQRPTR